MAFKVRVSLLTFVSVTIACLVTLPALWWLVVPDGQTVEVLPPFKLDPPTNTLHPSMKSLAERSLDLSTIKVTVVENKFNGRAQVPATSMLSARPARHGQPSPQPSRRSSLPKLRTPTGTRRQLGPEPLIGPPMLSRSEEKVYDLHNPKFDKAFAVRYDCNTPNFATVNVDVGFGVYSNIRCVDMGPEVAHKACAWENRWSKLPVWATCQRQCPDYTACPHIH